MTRSVYADNTLIEGQENDAWTKLFDFFTPNSAVLDAGCSSGNFGKALIEQKHCTVVGVDINEGDLEYAKQNLTKAFKRNIEQDDLSDLGKFDFVLMADVIEHLLTPVGALRKIKKLLLPDGKLVFSVPNMANIANRIELLGGRYKYTKYGLLDETHVHYYDRLEFEKVMAKAGFAVKKYDNTIRDLPATAITTELTKLGLTPSEKFLKMAKDIDAVTFQFIGVAEPVAKKTRTKKIDIESKTPYDFFSRQFDEVHRARKEQVSQIKSLKAELKEQKRVHSASQQELEQKTKRLQQRLEAIENSKGWHLLTRFYRLKQALSRAFRRK
ncbi:methyltransferase domain-containing protein [Candidatus Saccharibacteria bacterium]|nr:methyltransferase domain-containing protein [Candidatus Saccharibacteria bacterium]